MTNFKREEEIPMTIICIEDWSHNKTIKWHSLIIWYHSTFFYMSYQLKDLRSRKINYDITSSNSIVICIVPRLSHLSAINYTNERQIINLANALSKNFNGMPVHMIYSDRLFEQINITMKSRITENGNIFIILILIF